MNYCSNCGIKRVGNDKFCPQCGFKFGELSTPNLNSSKAKENSEKKGYLDLYKSTFEKFASFNGRASRKEYWTFIIITTVVSFLLGIIEAIFPDVESTLTTIFTVITFVPTIAVGVRRMHDVGKRGWWIAFPLVNLLLTLEKGDSSENRFGKPTND